MPSTISKFTFSRMEPVGALPAGFPTDDVTVTATSEDPNFPVTNVQSFSDLSLGSPFRSLVDTTFDIKFTFPGSTSLNWFLISGLRGLVDEGYISGAVTPRVELRLGSTGGTLVGEFEANPLTGDLWITVDVTSAVDYVLRFNGITDGSGLGFVEIKRIAGGNFSTFGTNILTGFSTTFQDRSHILTNNFGDEAIRFIRPRLMSNFRFTFVGKDADDAAEWRKFLGYAMSGEHHRAPQVPFWIAADPSGGIGPASSDALNSPEGETWFAPMFAYMTAPPRMVRMRNTGDNLFDINFQCIQVSP